METKHQQYRVLHVEKGRRGWVDCQTGALGMHWGCSGQMGSGVTEIGGWAPRTSRRTLHLSSANDLTLSPYRVLPEFWPWGWGEWSRLFPLSPTVCWLHVSAVNSHTKLYRQILHTRGINFLCALLHCSLLQWQKAQFSSNHVFCKNEPQEEKVRRELLLHVSVSDAICSVSHVFLDISAYTDNDTWVQAIFRTDSFPFHSNNCFFNTLEYAKCFFNKLLIGSRNNSETKRKL